MACLLRLLQVVKRIWAHIREHDLQNPKDRRKIIPDEVLGTFLTAPVNMMSMNSQLSKHCFTKGIITHRETFCKVRKIHILDMTAAVTMSTREGMLAKPHRQKSRCVADSVSGQATNFAWKAKTVIACT